MRTESGNGHDEALLAWHAATTACPQPWRRAAYLALRWSTAIAAAALPISLPLATAALVVALLAALVGRAPIHRAPGFAIAAAFSAWCLVSVAAGWTPGSQRLSVLYSWLAFPVAYLAYHDRATRQLALRLLVATLCAALLLAVVQFVVGFDLDRRPLRVSPDGSRFAHASGFLGYHLTYGAVTALLLPVFLAERGTRGRAIGAAAAGAAVVVSVARLAYLGAMAGVTAFLALAAVRRARALALAALLCITAAGGMALLAPDKLRAAATLQDGRFAIWQVTNDIIRDHPMLGVGGRRGYERAYVARWPEVVGWRDDLWVREPRMPHAHNSFLSIAAQHGLPALALYLLLMYRFARAAGQAGGRDRLAGAAAAAVLVTFVVCGQFNDLACQGETAYAFALALALALTGRRTEG